MSACTLDTLDVQSTLPAQPDSTVDSSVEPTADSDGWQEIVIGLERRIVQVPDTRATLTILRIDPTFFTFRAHYTPGDALRMSQWQSELEGATAFINTNFYDPENRILGLLVADGVIYGSAFTTRGGMFAVQNGVPTVRSNTLQPYQGEALEQAVQAFPMLVLNGTQAYTNTAPDRTTFRSAIGQDTSGRVLFMVTSQGGLTLLQLSAFLAQSDLNLTNAFNLDGGGSTMLSVQGTPLDFDFSVFDPVPAVLAIYSRE